MKKSIFLAIGFSFFLTFCFAAKWRVNNNSGVSADFTTIQAAHNGAASGDTIYVEGSAVNYGSLTCTKQLYIFGPGYFLTENDTTQANLSPATFSGTCYLSSGSSGTLISGISFSGYVIIQEGNIVFKRNHVIYQGVNVRSSASNVMILQNYIHATFSNSTYAAVRVESGSSNVFIQNNYLSRHSSSYSAILVEGTSSAEISNNVINGNVTVVTSSLINNIQRDGLLTATSSTLFNNIGHSTQYGTANGNQENVNMLSVFDSTQTSTDAQWKLLAGSPALAAGQSGEDCGMYGGIDPYVSSGIPAIPSIFFFSAPSSGSASTGLPVNIKIKANK